MLAVAPAHADWCRKPDGMGYEPCDTPPASWVKCESFEDGTTVWCHQSYGEKSKSKGMGSTNRILVVAGGVAFVGLMWYLFKTPKSRHFDGQVKLMEF